MQSLHPQGKRTTVRFVTLDGAPWAVAADACRAIDLDVKRESVVFADSRDVAAYFGRKHKDVLDAIRAKAAALTAEKSAVWFRPASFTQRTGFGSREMPCYEMTRQGFTLLVMGFTGAKAASATAAPRITPTPSKGTPSAAATRRRFGD